MNSDDSSMGISLPSIAKKRDGTSDEPGNHPVQLSKGGKRSLPQGFSLVCDDSYAPTGHVVDSENRRGKLNDGLGGVNLGSSGDCFGFLIPRVEDTIDADTRSRMNPHASTDESKLGKRLLSAAAVGGPSDFSGLIDESDPCASKMRRLNDEQPIFSILPLAVNPSAPLAPTRETMYDSVVGRAPRRMVQSVPEESEEWEARFSQREKQIEIGKGTKGYLNYMNKIPKNLRNINDPSTPVAREKTSKRQFDGKLREWRGLLNSYE
jgi:hypothetical protein